MTKTLILAACLTLAGLTPAVADSADGSSRDHDAIIRAAHDYAFGIAELDRARLERAFAMDQAQLKLILDKDGRQSVFVIPIRELMEKVWLKLPASPGHRIDVLDIQTVGGVYATITIDNNGEFIDHLSLYKLDGVWKIVDKLAIRHPDAPPSTLDLEAVFGSQSGLTIGMVPVGSEGASQ